MATKKYTQEDVQAVCNHKGIHKAAAEELFKQLESAEKTYENLGDWPEGGPDRKWILAKSAAYNHVQKLRSTLWDLHPCA